MRMDGQIPPPPMDGAAHDSERMIIDVNIGDQRIGLIYESYHRITGRDLVRAPSADIASALWESPMVILAHGTEPDPVFFYANRTALSLFEIAAEDLIRMPSRLSAEPMERDERSRFLQAVAQQNHISDYSGIRISRTGNRFRIAQATVWNLIDAGGTIHGQAACFGQWTPLERTP